jgi:hypothetical protein
MRTAAQKRYAEKNRQLLRARDTRRNHHNPERDAVNRNQRNSDLGWRWMAWSAHFRKRLTFDYKELKIISLKVLENPHFTFKYRGTKCYENLFSDLPYPYSSKLS